MAPRRFEIYRVDQRWRNSTDARPALVLGTPAGRVEVALISGNLDLFKPTIHFMISTSDPEFHLTGLDRPCFVSCQEVVLMDPTKLLRRYGELGPGIALRFEMWWAARL